MYPSNNKLQRRRLLGNGGDTTKSCGNGSQVAMGYRFYKAHAHYRRNRGIGGISKPRPLRKVRQHLGRLRHLVHPVQRPPALEARVPPQRLRSLHRVDVLPKRPDSGCLLGSETAVKTRSWLKVARAVWLGTCTREDSFQSTARAGMIKGIKGRGRWQT